MKVSPQNRSLARDYFIIAGIILATILALSIGYTWSVYKTQEAVNQQQLAVVANRIARQTDTALNYISSLSRFLGERIADSGGKDRNAIAAVLKQRLLLNDEIRQQFSWTMFDWVEPDKQLTVSTYHGVLDKPVDVSHRHYIKEALKEPGKLTFDSATYGLVSYQYIMPLGMGVADEEGNTLGAVTVGVNIEKFSQHLERNLDDKLISFVVLDPYGNTVFTSSDQKEQVAGDDFFLGHLSSLLTERGNRGHHVSEVKYGDVHYTYIQPTSQYPLHVLVGYNKSVAGADMIETLLPGVIGFTVIGLISLGIVIVLRLTVVKPVIALSDTADAIASGKKVTRVPRTYTYETANLAMHLLRVMRSVSRERRISDKLARTEAEAQIARHMAEEASQAKSSFLANMSHELRTPLQTISGYADAIQHKIYGPVNDQYLDAAGNIKTGAEHLMQLVSDILDISKIEAGQMEMYEEEIALDALVRECIGLLSVVAIKKNITVHYNPESNIPKLKADAQKVSQILINLLSNAIKYSDEGKEIWVSTVSKKSGLVLEVKDEGIGVAEEDLAEVLGEFGQAKRVYARKKEQGTGLGLPMVQKLVELHQGSFTFNSILGKGTTVIITFPAHRVIKKTRKQ